MVSMKSTQHTTNLRSRVLLLSVISTFVLAACNATTKPQRKEANIEIQEAVGFTITEEVQVPESIRLQYYEALRYLRDENLQLGIAVLEQVTDAAPTVTAPKIDLGVAHHRLGDLDRAEEYLLQALELNSNHPVALNELGIVYRETGRFAEAKQRYEAAIAVYPGYHHARRNLAILCDLYLGDLNCALKQYEAYMATVPADPEAQMWITDLRNRMAK
jgi:Flp pilus assembly protein TadD